MSLSRPRSWFFLVGLAAAVGVAGCNKPVGTVTGKVSYNGLPLKGGNVTLANAEAGPSYSGTIGEDGMYTILNAQAGEYKVCVETASLKPDPSSMPKTPKVDPKAPKSGDDIPAVGSNPRRAQEARNVKKYVPIPDKYSKTESTDLTYTVVGGNQTNDINLK